MKNLYKKTSCIILLVFVCSIFGLSQKYYLLDEGEMLLIGEKGDIKLSSVFPGEGLYSAQLGISPIKHLSITSSFIYDKSTQQEFDFTGSYEQITKGFSANAAIGSYIFLKTKKQSPKRFYLSKNVTMEEGFLFDLYAGYSYGQIDNFYYRNAMSHFDLSKFYVQAGVHWVFRIGTLSYAFRAVNLDYYNGNAIGSLEEEELKDLFQGGIEDNEPFSFYESSFRYQIGIRQVRIYTGVTTKHRKDNIRPHEDKRTIITAGMIFELDEIFGKKAEEIPEETD